MRSLVFSGFLLCSSVAYADTVPAVSAYNFIDTIGINTHLNNMWGDDFYGNVKNVESELYYIGVRYARDTFSGHTHIANMQQVNKDTGIKYDIIFHSDFSYDTQLSDLRSNIGMVAEVEGPNEVDNWPTLFGGLKGYIASITMQRKLYRDIKTFASTASKNVNSLTLANEGNLLSVGDLSDFADNANIHSYPQWGGYWGAFAYPSIKWSLDTFGALAKSKQKTLSESGWWTLPAKSGVPENVQAKFTLNLLFDAFALGVKRTYIYQLNDEYADDQGSDIEKHFGLFKADRTPKHAATALHNLIVLLKDDCKDFVTGSLGYSVTGLNTPSGHQLLLQKSNGNFIIVLWNESMFWDNEAHVEKPTDKVTAQLNLDIAPSMIRVFDPLVSTNALVYKNKVTNMEVQVPDHPILIFVTP